MEILVALSHSSIELYELSTTAHIKTINYCIGPDNNKASIIADALDINNILVYNNLHPNLQVISLNSNSINKPLLYLPNNRTVSSLITNNDYIVIVSFSKSKEVIITIYSKYSGTLINEIDITQHCNNSSIDMISFSDDSSYIIMTSSTSGDGTINIFSVSKLIDPINTNNIYNPEFTLNYHSLPVSKLLVNNNYIFTSSYDKTIKIYDMNTEKVKSLVLNVIPLYIAVDKNCSRIYFCGNDGKLYYSLFSYNMSENIYSSKEIAPITQIQLCLDDSIIVALCQDGIRLYTKNLHISRIISNRFFMSSFLIFRCIDNSHDIQIQYPPLKKIKEPYNRIDNIPYRNYQDEKFRNHYQYSYLDDPVNTKSSDDNKDISNIYKEKEKLIEEVNKWKNACNELYSYVNKGT